MTEAEWLACADAGPMVGHVGEAGGERKLRLFAVACCRRFPTWVFEDERLRQGIAVAERYAEGTATQDELERTQADLDPVEDHGGWPERWVARLIRRTVGLAAGDIAEQVTQSWGAEPFDDPEEAARNGFAPGESPQATLLRCIFGNPFRPVALDPSWLTSDVAALARGIYDERAFDRMPILADALQDAGCDSAAVLAHCRDAGPHARGCWVVDLVLGKA